MKILVTGAAGFIGFHLCEKLLKLGYSVVGIDNLNDYYDVALKLARLKQIGIESVNKEEVSESVIYGNHFHFYKMNLEDELRLPTLFKEYRFDCVCNLAAQAGVRYSIENPKIYVQSNIVGFINLLECVRNNGVKKLVYASSSSVYGNSDEVPFSTTQNVDNPISLYAATKKSNELMAHTYSHLFDIQTIGLRFFTVYGPWGRPDMAMFLFTDAIINNKPLSVFNNGELSRDFTFISDIIDGIVATIEKPAIKQYNIYNIGNNKPEKLLDFIQAIEKALNKKAIKQMLPMQAGDVNRTWANIADLTNDYGYTPKTAIDQGVAAFVKWYLEYYQK